MDTADALKDIDTVLGTLKEHDETSVFVAVAAERITRLHACIVRYAPPSSTYRQRADEYGAMTFAKNVLIGVLKALRSDLENGRLVTLPTTLGVSLSRSLAMKKRRRPQIPSDDGYSGTQ